MRPAIEFSMKKLNQLVSGRTPSPVAAAAALAALLTFPVRSALAADRVTLKSLVVTHEDVVTMSDLLPEGVPDSVHARLHEIKLGVAPLPGAHRIFRRSEILHRVAAIPAEPLLMIPETVDVTRWSRPVTTRDLLAPIVESIRASHFEGGNSLTARNLSLSSPVLATEGAPQFRVTRIDSMPHGTTRVHVLITSEPRVPPFWVVLDRAIQPQSSTGIDEGTGSHDAVSVTDRSKEHASTSPSGANDSGSAAASRELTAPRQRREAAIQSHQRSSSNNPILVKAGQPVQLVVQGDGMRIATTAIPLALGREGDRIRVHTILSGKILIATVVAPQTVEVDYLGSQAMRPNPSRLSPAK